MTNQSPTHETILRLGLLTALVIIVPSVEAFSVAIDPSPLTRVLDDFNDGVDTITGFNNMSSAGEAGGVTSVQMPAAAGDPQFQVPTPGAPFSASVYPYLRINARGSVAGGDGVFPLPAAGTTRIGYAIGASFSEFRAQFVDVPPGINGSGLRIDPAGGGTTVTESFDYDYIMLDQVATVGAGEFDRDGTLDGWVLNPGIVGGSSSAATSTFSATTTGPDPTMTRSGLSADSSVFQTIDLRIAVDPLSTSRVDLYWGTDTNPGPAAGQKVELTSELIRDGNLHTYRIDMSDEAAWDGTVQLLRFDPFADADAAAGRSFEIDYIRLVAIPEASSILLVALGGLATLRRRR